MATAPKGFGQRGVYDIVLGLEDCAEMRNPFLLSDNKLYNDALYVKLSV